MIRIGILGEIGSGKSYVAKNFGYPVFDADFEVSKLYSKNKKIFIKLNKSIPKHISSFPIDKNEIIKAILSNRTNFKKIINIVHKEIKKKMNLFMKKNKSKKIVIMDIPLLLENKLNNKRDILIFIESKKIDIEKRLKKRAGFNLKLINKFRKIQFKADFKIRKSNYIIKNDYTKRSIRRSIKNILNEILE